MMGKKSNNNHWIEQCIVVFGKKIRLHLHPDETGGFWVDSPDMKGLVTQGDTVSEAVENGFDAAMTITEAKVHA